MASVGYIIDPAQANRLVERGDTDIVLLGREMLTDPNWPLHAHRALGGDPCENAHVRFGNALGPRVASLRRLSQAGETPLDRFKP